MTGYSDVFGVSIEVYIAIIVLFPLVYFFGIGFLKNLLLKIKQERLQHGLFLLFLHLYCI